MSGDAISGEWKAEWIQRRMAQIRRDLYQTVDEISDQARQLRDWRYYLRRYPWAFAAAATAVGYLVVPSRPRVIHVDAGAAAALGDQGRPPAEARAGLGQSLARLALGHLGRVALRSATQYVAERLSAPGRPFGEASGSGRRRPP
jgi:hypothetical protein